MQDSPVAGREPPRLPQPGRPPVRGRGRGLGPGPEGVGFGAAFGDLSGDGNLDIVYANYDGGRDAPAQRLRHRPPDQRRPARDGSNRFGVGATVTVESALGVQVRQLVLARGYMSSSEPMLHFGLGDDASIRRMTVDLAERPRAGVRRPAGRPPLHDDRAVRRRWRRSRAEPAGRPPLFAEVSRAVGLSAGVARGARSTRPAVQPLMPLRLNRRGPAVAVGDIFGDGRDDVGDRGHHPRSAARPAPAGPGTSSRPGRRVALGSRAPIDDGPSSSSTPRGRGRRTCWSPRAATPCRPAPPSTSRGST